ncbi:ankyrin repeat plant-like protein [Trifolium pratense]|uniref:Ankyrin repeat plant-like protein n=1 Tax=Trifolium pratense TaxID=57577 RepID=A0A2K3L2E2_TRIPR|nr:ankyrin repeat plant-like protein [Trifolium pratense]
MWDKYLFLDDIEMKKIMSEPDQVTFIAAEVGNFEFLSVVTSTYPDLIWELNNEGQSIIYIAILHRHANIFNLIHEIGAFKDFITSFVDDNNNNFLHSVAKLAPPDRLNIVSGAALQMMLELSCLLECPEIGLPIDNIFTHSGHPLASDIDQIATNVLIMIEQFIFKIGW